jgi:hypothetical protein
MVLYGTLSCFSPDAPDYLWGQNRAQLAELQDVENHWGGGALADFFFGELADIPGFRDLYGRLQRTSASPTMAWMLLRRGPISTCVPFSMRSGSRRLF